MGRHSWRRSPDQSAPRHRPRGALPREPQGLAGPTGMGSSPRSLAQHTGAPHDTTAACVSWAGNSGSGKGASGLLEGSGTQQQPQGTGPLSWYGKGPGDRRGFVLACGPLISGSACRAHRADSLVRWPGGQCALGGLRRQGGLPDGWGLRGWGTCCSPAGRVLVLPGCQMGTTPCCALGGCERWELMPGLGRPGQSGAGGTAVRGGWGWGL